MLVLRIGQKSDIAHRAGIGSDVGHQALRMLAREQHIGEYRRFTFRESRYRQVDIRVQADRCAAEHGIRALLEALHPHRFEQRLGQIGLLHPVDQLSTAAIALAVASTLLLLSPAMHIRPERRM